MKKSKLSTIFLFILTHIIQTAEATNGPVGAITRIGSPHDSYKTLVNPNAPKGGDIKLATTGTFDSVNPFSFKGIPIQYMQQIVFESLMYRAPNEPFTLYGLIAEKVAISKDYSSVTFYLNPKAKFQDESPVTSEDIKATFHTLMNKGLPRYKANYQQVKEVILHDLHTIEFKFQTPPSSPDQSQTLSPLELRQANEKVCFSLALMPVLSKKQLDSIDFQSSGLSPLLGTGPYRIHKVEQGRSVVFARDTNYWGASLPIREGNFNFDYIQIDYYKNAHALFQAFFSKEFDIYFEVNPQQWIRDYINKPQIIAKKIIKQEIAHNRPVLVKALIMNARKPLFQDIELRRAFILALDIQSITRTMFANEFKVPHSLFPNTYLAHQADIEPLEKEILQEFKSQMPEEFFQTLTEKGAFPSSFGYEINNHRANLQYADETLTKAGYKLKDGKRYMKNGIDPITVTLLLKDEKLEKIALHFKNSLKKLGILLIIRKVDANSYENFVTEASFDIIFHAFMNSLSPGIEQVYYFSQKTANMKGSSNYIGINDPIAEALAKKVANALTPEELKASARALDRYIMNLGFFIPLSYDHKLRFAYWKDRIAFPALNADYDMDVMSRGWAVKALEK